MLACLSALWCNMISVLALVVSPTDVVRHLLAGETPTLLNLSRWKNLLIGTLGMWAVCALIRLRAPGVLVRERLGKMRKVNSSVCMVTVEFEPLNGGVDYIMVKGPLLMCFGGDC